VPLSQQEPLASAQAKFALLQYFRKALFVNAPEIDPAHVAELVSRIHESDLAEFMFDVTVLGKTEVMHALQTLRGPVAVQYVHQAGERRHAINGKSFSPKRNGTLTHCISVAEIKEVFALVKAYGFKGLIEPGLTIPFLFTENNCSGLLNIVRDTSFKGELPFLEAGRLKSPELAICLSDESIESVTPEAFMPMLCWATAQMVKEFGDSLTPLRPLQRVDYDVLRPADERSEEDPYRCMSIPAADFKANSKPIDEAVVTEIAMGIEHHANISPWAGNLNRYMGNEFTCLGFPDLDGRILCEARVDFLLSFPAALCTEQNLLESKRFAKAYFPFDILAIQTLKACETLFGHPPQAIAVYEQPLTVTYRNAFNRLFESLDARNEVHERLLDMLTKAQWLGLAKNSETFSLTAEALIALRDQLGLDNKGMALSLVPSDVDKLSEAGYRFIDNTQGHKDFDFLETECDPDLIMSAVTIDLTAQSISFTLDDDSGSKVVDEAVRLHGLVQSMNLWLCKAPKPTSVRQALGQIVGLNITNPSHQQAMALYAFLVGQGIAACAKEATSSEEWLLLTEMFSDEEIAPYLPIMPGKAKGRVLSSSMGL
jgi:hypothetical protein